MMTAARSRWVLRTASESDFIQKENQTSHTGITAYKKEKNQTSSKKNHFMQKEEETDFILKQEEEDEEEEEEDTAYTTKEKECIPLLLRRGAKAEVTNSGGGCALEMKCKKFKI